jgi:sugar phosphate isomerase/epimerase
VSTAFTLGMFTDALYDLSTREVFEWAADNGLDALELGTGGNSSTPHVTAKALGTDEGRRELQEHVRATGVSISALNCSGNPLWPHPGDGRNRDDRILRETLVAAALLGVPRVVCMSGCPGSSPADGRPAFLPAEWHSEDSDVLKWQWDDCLLPYWRELLDFAAARAPSVRICLELDPGYLVFSARTFLRFVTCLDADTAQIGINLDPSHLFWQRADPLRVIQDLGAFVGHVHAKDTVLDEDWIARNGWLDQPPREDVDGDRPYRYATVGDGHDVAWWSAFCRALKGAGYHGHLSVEWEDDRVAPERSLLRALETLRAAISAIEGADPNAG